MAVKSGAELKPLLGVLGVCVAMRVYAGSFKLHQVAYFVSDSYFAVGREKMERIGRGLVCHTRSFL